MNLPRFIATIAFASTPVIAADLVVIDSTSPDHEAGELISDTIPISLDEGRQLTLISEDGTVISIIGPFSGLPASTENEQGRDVLDALGQLIGDTELVAVDIGGVRIGETGGTPSTAPTRDSRNSPWTIHSELSAIQCYVEEDDRVQLWREDNADEQVTIVGQVGETDSLDIRWDPGSNVATWPSDAPIGNGSVYLFRNPDEYRSVAIQLLGISRTIAKSDTAVVAFLAANGCLSQARIALNNLRPSS